MNSNAGFAYYLSDMESARKTVETITRMLSYAPDVLANVLVEETRSNYEPGGYARYLCMAAWREMFAGE